MTIEKQVVSVELAKRLKELGVKQESAFSWMTNGDEADELEPDLLTEEEVADLCLDDVISAFTVAELGEMLPARLDNGRVKHGLRRLAMEKQDTRWNIVYICATCGGREFEPLLADTEADARAKMLVYLIENKLITL